MEARAAELEERGAAAYIAEFVGTFLLVLFICVAASQSGGTGVTDFAVIGLVYFLALAEWSVGLAEFLGSSSSWARSWAPRWPAATRSAGRR